MKQLYDLTESQIHAINEFLNTINHKIFCKDYISTLKNNSCDILHEPSIELRGQIKGIDTLGLNYLINHTIDEICPSKATQVYKQSLEATPDHFDQSDIDSLVFEYHESLLENVAHYAIPLQTAPKSYNIDYLLLNKSYNPIGQTIA